MESRDNSVETKKRKIESFIDNETTKAAKNNLSSSTGSSSSESDEEEIIPPPKIVRQKLLGEGGYGSVWLCLFSNKQFALKEPKENSQYKIAAMEKEKRILSYVNQQHDHLPKTDPHREKIIEMFPIDGLCKYQLALEYLPRGSLYTCIRKNKKYLTDVASIKILTDVAYALDFLANIQIVHLDLKSDNILLTTEGNAKLADFGFADYAYEELTDILGTLRWRAPEIGVEQATHKADIYSLGMVAWELKTLTLPYVSFEFKSKEERRAFFKLVQGGFREIIPSDCEPKYAALITRCWEQNPKQRPAAEEVVKVLGDIKSLRI